MLTPINEGFVEQWRGVGATDAELAEVVSRDGSAVLAEMDHPNVGRWIRLVALQQPAKPSGKTERPSLLGMATSFTKAMFSRAVHGRVELPIFQQRANQCHGDGVTPPCPARAFNEKTGHHWCTECGCGSREHARLSQSISTADWPILIPAGDDYELAPYIKLMYPSLDCPRQRAGFRNAVLRSTQSFRTN